MVEMQDPLQRKICLICGENRKKDEYRTSRYNIDGLQNVCKDCERRAKQCTQCGKIKYLEGFYNDKRDVTGKTQKCGECLRAKRITQYYKERDGEKIIVSEKPCRRCKKVKPVGDFSKHRARKDGYAAMCKPCRKSYIEEKYGADWWNTYYRERWHRVKAEREANK